MTPVRVAVCLKAIWRTDTALRLQSSGGVLNPDGRQPVLNPADRSALGLAMRLKAQVAEVGIHALTVGPPAWDGILRDALASGAADAQRLWHQGWPESRTLELDGSAETTRLNARAAATALRTLSPALVLAGSRSADAGHECFGAYLAEALGMAYAHRVTDVEAIRGGWRVIVELERGYTQRMELPAPVVLTVSPHVAGPPEASMTALLHSRTAPLGSATVDLAATIRGATTVRVPIPRVKRYTVPAPTLSAEERIRSMVTLKTSGGGTVIGAGQSPEQQADGILELLRNQGYLPR